LCPDGAKCFDNACRPACATTADCPEGESCKSAVTDHGTKGRFCVGTPKPTPGTNGAACAKNDDCQSDYGFHCIDDVCTLTCDLPTQCGATGSCTGSAKDVDGTPVRTCEKDKFPHAKGQYGSTCPNVAGADAGAAGCDTANDFVCVGRGPGDVDAYCTQ